MKTVPAQDLATNLNGILKSAQRERILISRRGKACAVLLGIEGYDLEDLQLARSEDFWGLIRQRRKRGKSFPLEEVAARLGISRPETVRKPASRKRANKPPLR